MSRLELANMIAHYEAEHGKRPERLFLSEYEYDELLTEMSPEEANMWQPEVIWDHGMPIVQDEGPLVCDGIFFAGVEILPCPSVLEVSL